MEAAARRLEDTAGAGTVGLDVPRADGDRVRPFGKCGSEGVGEPRCRSLHERHAPPLRGVQLFLVSGAGEQKTGDDLGLADDTDGDDHCGHQTDHHARSGRSGAGGDQARRGATVVRRLRSPAADS